MVTETKSEYYQQGFDRGQGIASWVDIPDPVPASCAEWCGACESPSAILSCLMVSAASEAESNDRQNSPFEFTAHDLNKLDEAGEEGASEEAWEEFDEGIADGIAANIANRLANWQV